MLYRTSMDIVFQGDPQLERLSFSLDINPILYVLDNLERKVSGRLTSPRFLQELKLAIWMRWFEYFSSSLIFIDCMPQRC